MRVAVPKPVIEPEYKDEISSELGQVAMSCNFLYLLPAL